VAALDIEPVDPRAGGYLWTAVDGSLLIGPALPAPVISEIMYHPSGGEPDWKWVEICDPDPLAWAPAAVSSRTSDGDRRAAADAETWPLRVAEVARIRDLDSDTAEAAAEAQDGSYQDLQPKLAALDPLLAEIAGDIAAAWR
jgi:hypothetical protein